GDRECLVQEAEAQRGGDRDRQVVRPRARADDRRRLARGRGDGARVRQAVHVAMSPISRGFRGRREAEADPARVPPGQYVTHDFPVLSAGPTPHTPLDEWTFTIRGAVDEPRSWGWEEFRALPSETVTRDIHCVTKWSKLDTTWTGVSLDALLDGLETSAEYATAFS